MRQSDSQVEDQNDDNNEYENEYVLVDYPKTEIVQSKSCPNCTQLNKKHERSLLVQCFRCKLEFCWFCLESLESANHNLHDLAHFTTCVGRNSMTVYDQVVNGLEFTMPNIVKDAWGAFTNYVKLK